MWKMGCGWIILLYEFRNSATIKIISILGKLFHDITAIKNK